MTEPLSFGLCQYEVECLPDAPVEVPPDRKRKQKPADEELKKKRQKNADTLNEKYMPDKDPRMARLEFGTKAYDDMYKIIVGEYENDPEYYGLFEDIEFDDFQQGVDDVDVFGDVVNYGNELQSTVLTPVPSYAVNNDIDEMTFKYESIYAFKQNNPEVFMRLMYLVNAGIDQDFLEKKYSGFSSGIMNDNRRNDIYDIITGVGVENCPEFDDNSYSGKKSKLIKEFDAKDTAFVKDIVAKTLKGINFTVYDSNFVMTNHSIEHLRKTPFFYIKLSGNYIYNIPIEKDHSWATKSLQLLGVDNFNYSNYSFEKIHDLINTHCPQENHPDFFSGKCNLFGKVFCSLYKFKSCNVVYNNTQILPCKNNFQMGSRCSCISFNAFFKNEEDCTKFSKKYVYEGYLVVRKRNCGVCHSYTLHPFRSYCNNPKHVENVKNRVLQNYRKKALLFETFAKRSLNRNDPLYVFPIHHATDDQMKEPSMCFLDSKNTFNEMTFKLMAYIRNYDRVVFGDFDPDLVNRFIAFLHERKPGLNIISNNPDPDKDYSQDPGVVIPRISDVFSKEQRLGHSNANFRKLKKPYPVTRLDTKIGVKQDLSKTLVFKNSGINKKKKQNVVLKFADGVLENCKDKN